MRSLARISILGTIAAAGALALSAAPAVAAGSGAYTCTGGEIPSGHYSNVMVTGACAVATNAVITVSGSVIIGAGAVLDAQHASAKITVEHNVTAVNGALVGLGCQPGALVGNSGHPCTDDDPDNPTSYTDITVNGNITASNAVTFDLNGVKVKGNVTFSGGGSQEIPWAIKNNTIGGNLTVTGQSATWLGVLFNKVAGNVTLANIAINDPDGGPGVFVGHNRIGRNLTCVGLTPGVSGGFGPPPSNTVGGHATGQCAALV